MMTCRRGDVVLVPFPFTDLSTTKQRPALVISPDGWNLARQDVVLVAITSQITSSVEASDLHLSPDDELAAGLPKPSLIRPTKLFTMHRGLLKRTLGQLPAATTETVLGQLRVFFT